MTTPSVTPLRDPDDDRVATVGRCRDIHQPVVVEVVDDRERERTVACAAWTARDMMEVAEKVAEIMTEHNAMTLTEMSDEWDAIDAKDINRQTALSALALVRQYVMDGILFFPPGQG